MKSKNSPGHESKPKKTDVRHEIKGILVRFNIPWYNGTVIAPEAFKDCHGKTIPITVDFGPFLKDCNPEIGWAELEWKEDGMYYFAHLNQGEKADELIEKVLDHDWRLGLYANQIKRADHRVVYGKICAAAFSAKCDKAAATLEVDGKPFVPKVKANEELMAEKIINHIRKKDPESYKTYRFEPDDILTIIKYYYYDRLKWCGCAQPGDAMRCVFKFLNALKEKDNREEAFKGAFGVEHVYDNDLLLCLAYSMDAAGLTDHGSSINWCWLTEDGEYFCWAIEQAEKLEELDI